MWPPSWSRREPGGDGRVISVKLNPRDSLPPTHRTIEICSYRNTSPGDSSTLPPSPSPSLLSSPRSLHSTSFSLPVLPLPPPSLLSPPLVPSLIPFLRPSTCPSRPLSALFLPLLPPSPPPSLPLPLPSSSPSPPSLRFSLNLSFSRPIPPFISPLPSSLLLLPPPFLLPLSPYCSIFPPPSLVLLPCSFSIFPSFPLTPSPSCPSLPLPPPNLPALAPHSSLRQPGAGLARCAQRPGHVCRLLPGSQTGGTGLGVGPVPRPIFTAVFSHVVNRMVRIGESVFLRLQC